MDYPGRVQICEVGPRDGLQNEQGEFSTADKVALVGALADTGIPTIEVTSMVSPRAVPQMADGEQVLAQIRRRPGTRYRVLVPNLKGTERALGCDVDELAYAVVATETYSRKNWNMSVDESLEQVRLSIERVRRDPRPLRVITQVAVAFGCPYEGDVPVSEVMRIIAAYVDMGTDEVGLNDSAGMGNPRQVEELVARVRDRWPELTLSLHLHNTRGTGLANLVAGLRQGIARIDAAVGGLGGCPFSPHAAGNVCTEDAVNMLHDMGIETGIDLDRLLAVVPLAGRIVGHPLPGLVHRSSRRPRCPGQGGLAGAGGVERGGG